MKQIKSKNKKSTKATIVPKMSMARQNYIKRFRRNIIRKANLQLKKQIQTNPIKEDIEPNEGSKTRKRKMTIQDTQNADQLRRVRFDEQSNETFQNPRWIEDMQDHESQSQQQEWTLKGKKK